MMYLNFVNVLSSFTFIIYAFLILVSNKKPHDSCLFKDICGFFSWDLGDFSIKICWNHPVKQFFVGYFVDPKVPVSNP